MPEMCEGKTLLELELAKYRFLVENLPYGFAYHQVVTGADGSPVDFIFLEVNPAFTEMTGLTRHRVLGKKISAVFPEFKGSSFDWRGTYGRVATTGEAVRFQHYSQMLGRWYEIKVYRDRPSFLVTFFHDITEVKREMASLETLVHLAEKYLQSPLGEPDYQSLAEDLLGLAGAKFAGFNIYTEDGKKSITRAFAGFKAQVRLAERILGFEFVGREWEANPQGLRCIEGGKLVRFDSLAEAMFGAIPGQVAKFLQRVFGIDHVYVLGINHRGRAVGDFIFFMGQGTKLQNPRMVELYAKQVGFLLSRSRAEAMLQQREQQLQAVLKGQSELLCRYLPDGTITFVNEAFLNFWGQTEEELSGRSLFTLLPPEDAQALRAHLASLTPALPTGSFELQVVTPAGDTRWLQWTDRAFFGAEGATVEYQSVGRDVTELKKTEAALRFQLACEKMVAEISAALVSLPAARVDEGIDLALQLLGNFFNLDRSYIFQYSSDGKSMSNTHEWCKEGIAPQREILQELPVDLFPWWMAKLSRAENIVIPSVAALPAAAAAEKALLQAQSIRSVLVVPMRYAGMTLGFLGFDAVEAEKDWEERHVAILRTIAEILAGILAGKKWEEELELKGLELEELYRQLEGEIHKARQIHERTLPHTLPELKGLTLVGHYQPARRLGGDFYNVIKTGEKLVLYLSDVSGHGLEGTILSTFIKEAIDSYLSLKGEEVCPEKILRHLYRQYCQEDYPDDYFICIFLAVLDLTEMELLYTGAGFQVPPLVRLGSGEKTCLLSEGPPISRVIPEELMDFSVKRLALTPGTTVLFTTDGLMEQEADGQDYGSRLETIFYQYGYLPPRLLVRLINEDFRSFNGGSSQGDDDITIGLLQRDPEEKRECRLELRSDLGELHRIYFELAPLLDNVARGEEFFFCLHELAANAIEHGNRFDAEKTVTLEIGVTESCLYALVKDQGDGFAWRKTSARSLDLEGHQERGRGLAMTRLWGDLLLYNEKGNRAMFALSLFP